MKNTTKGDNLGEKKRIHLIAIGGSAMHNIALALHHKGFHVTGSDDEIYDPARSRLAKYGLLPAAEGWHTERITPDLEAIIVGMHAREDNPELHRARKLGIRIYSYPEYIYEQSKQSRRIVVAGSHGKTTTTAMILHVLQKLGRDTDYLVGAQLEGFETMVRLSDAPIIVLEGDEYLASPLDRRPKIHFYKPHLSIITGIAWDHINVFPTFENYVEQFEIYIKDIEKDGVLFWYKNDEHLRKIADVNPNIRTQAYDTPTYEVVDNQTFIIKENKKFPLQIFGKHNLQNLESARLVCGELGIDDGEFYEAISDFGGAARRLQLLHQSDTNVVYLDFAHAPSKVEATIRALKEQYPDRPLTACLELHTFSSLNKNFLKEYRNTIDAADIACVYFSEHTLKMKRLPELSTQDIVSSFGHPNMKVFTQKEDLINFLEQLNWKNSNLLMMSSGKFGGVNLENLIGRLFD